MPIRKIKVLLDLETLTSKAAVLPQLAEQSQGGIFLAHGIHKKVYVYKLFGGFP